MHGTCGLNDPWHQTCERCQAGLEIPAVDLPWNPYDDEKTSDIKSNTPPFSQAPPEGMHSASITTTSPKTCLSWTHPCHSPLSDIPSQDWSLPTPRSWSETSKPLENSNMQYSGIHPTKRVQTSEFIVKENSYLSHFPIQQQIVTFCLMHDISCCVCRYKTMELCVQKNWSYSSCS